MLLDNLTLFLKIVEKGGLAVAGRDMGLSPATVSERLTALESYYGATLLKRTTRAIHLTEEGRLLVDGAKRLLAEAEELEARIKLGVNTVSGPIRLSAPADLGRHRIAPLIDDFLARHPAVNIELILSDQYSDMIQSGLDCAIRFGDLDSSTLKVKKIGESRRVVCAAPSYLATHPAPISPCDLEQHNCLIMRFGQKLDNEWPFHIDGRKCKILVKGNRIADDGGQVRNWCLAGHGIAYKSNWDVKDDIAAGRLVALLEEFATTASQIQIVYPQTAVMPHRVRLFIDFLADGLTR